MTGILTEIAHVSWSDMMYLKRNIGLVLITSLMSPLLYLIAFGYGLGSNVTSYSVPYIAFIIPGIVALSALSSSFSSTSARINVQRLYHKSFDNMMLSPLRPSSIVLGKAMLGTVRGLISCSIIFAIGLILQDELNLTLGFVVCLLLSCISFSLLGEFVALVADSHQKMATFNTLIILPMTFLCGTFFSLSALPRYVSAIIYLLPLTHASECLRATALGWDVPWISIVVLSAYGILFFLLNLFWIVKKKV